MTDATPRIGAPYLVEGQGSPEVTLNAGLFRMDMVVQAAVIDRDLTAPPGAPAEGHAYLVAASATGAWSGRDDQIAAWDGSAWQFVAPWLGFLLYIADEAVLLVKGAGGWEGIAAAAGLTIADVSGLAGALAGKQDAHANLAAFAGLALAADLLPYADGAGTLATTAFTVAARALLADADAAAMRATLSAVSLAGDTMIGPLIVAVTGGNGFIEARGDSGANFFTTLFAASSGTGPRFLLRRTRGTMASPAGVASGDVLGTYGFQAAYNATPQYRSAAEIQAVVTEPTPTSPMGTRLLFSVTAVGATSPSEAARLEHATGLSMFGANPVIDQNRIFRLRLYTIATLPTASTCPNGQTMVSDPAGGKGRLVWNDGSAWYYASDASAV